MALVALANSKYEYDFGNGRKARLGDTTDLAKFKPCLEFGCWNDEVKVKFLLNVTGNFSPTKSGDALSAENASFLFDWMPTLPKLDFNDSGGYDWKITLKKKPPTNSFTFSYEQTLVMAYHQPPLTNEFIPGQKWEDITIGLVSETDAYDDKGNLISHRPEHIVNSIAFWHAIRSNIHASQADADKYKDCKIGHLYRMKATDAVGKTEWLNWSLGTGTITATIAQAFLDAAVYPVVIAPVGDTFGYTSIPGSSDTYGLNRMRSHGDGYTGVAGTGDSMTLYCANTSGNNVNFKMAMYVGTALATNTTTAAHLVLSSESTPEWHMAAFASAPTLDTSSYYMPILSDGTLKIYYDVTGGNYRYQDTTYPTFPGTATWTVGGAARKFGAYCTVTTSTTQTKTGTAKGRILATLTKTQTALARILQPASKTMTALGRMLAPASKTGTALARMLVSLSKTGTAQARILVSQSKTMTALATIVIGAYKTGTAQARILATLTKTGTAKARMQVAQSKTMTALGRMLASTSKTGTALGRILAPTSKTTMALARILAPLSKTVAGVKARMQVVQSKTMAALASIVAAGVITQTKTLTALARMLKADSKTLTAMARIATRTNLAAGLGRKLPIPDTSRPDFLGNNRPGYMGWSNR